MNVILLVVLLVPCSPSAATPAYHVSVDLSDLGGSGFQLQAALYDNSGVIGDSLVRIDYVMRLDEDPVVNPTIVYRDYLIPDSAELSFDFEMVASDTVGFWGEDELVFSLLDPTTLDPLVSGLTGLGDVLAVRASGMEYVDTVAVTTVLIPAPAALMLGLIGVGGVAVWRRRTRFL